LPEFTDPLGSLAIESLNFVTDSQKTMMYLVMNSSYDTRPMRQLYLETTESNGIGMLLPKDMYFANNHEMVAEFPKLDPSEQYFFRVEAYTPLTGLSIPVAIK
jgi:asparagine synthetase A